MAFDSGYFINKVLGEDFESLLKSDIYKPGSRTVVDINDIKIGLQIVPRTVMSLLIRELVPMNVGESKEVSIPLKQNAILKVIKHERDSLSGEIIQDNKKIAEFMHRSIPGIGLVLMSALELYDIDNLQDESKQAPAEDITKKVQHLIDERLALHDLIGKVVDKKIEEKDAIKQLILAKITESMKKPETAVIAKVEVIKEESVKSKKESPLKSFLEQKKNKPKPNEFSIQMAKNEQINCPDCGKNIFDKQIFSACVCYGDSGKVHIKKTEEGIKIRFGKSWDIENIQMLLEVLRKKHE